MSLRPWVDELKCRRLLAAIAPDVTFGQDGLLAAAVERNSSVAVNAVRLLRANEAGIVITRFVNDDDVRTLAVERYGLDGRPDPAFAAPAGLLTARRHPPDRTDDAAGRGLNEATASRGGRV